MQNMNLEAAVETLVWLRNRADNESHGSLRDSMRAAADNLRAALFRYAGMGDSVSIDDYADLHAALLADERTS